MRSLNLALRGIWWRRWSSLAIWAVAVVCTAIAATGLAFAANAQDAVLQSNPRLSGGEQQRVAVARAIVIAPHVLLADEPTAQLDPHSRTVVVELLQRVAAGGTTVVLATHDTEVAAECDTVAELRSMVVARPTEE